MLGFVAPLVLERLLGRRCACKSFSLPRLAVFFTLFHKSMYNLPPSKVFPVSSNDLSLPFSFSLNHSGLSGPHRERAGVTTSQSPPHHTPRVITACSFFYPGKAHCSGRFFLSGQVFVICLPFRSFLSPQPVSLAQRLWLYFLLFRTVYSP